MSKLDRVLALIDSQIRAGHYLGASLAYYDSTSWQQVYRGTIDGYHPTVADLRYDLASVSKVVGVTTQCLMWLEAGRLDLDKPLTDYYPLFCHQTVTIRQLLTHTSGLDPYIPNRHRLNCQQLITAIHHLKQFNNQKVHYTDVNFILLGLMIASLEKDNLARVFQRSIFTPLKLTQTTYGPVVGAVPTKKGIVNGLVHDPKAQVLGSLAGSAGLFSTLFDLQRFCDYYLHHWFGFPLDCDYAKSDQKRSLGWDLQDDWLVHTGYTGPFILLNLKKQRAAIFLSNRTYQRDNRQSWIEQRNLIIDAFKTVE